MNSTPGVFPFDDELRYENDWSDEEVCPCCKLQYSKHNPAEAIACARKIIKQAVRKSRFLE